MINDSSRKRKFRYRSMGVIALLTAAAVLASACSAPGSKGLLQFNWRQKQLKLRLLRSRKLAIPLSKLPMLRQERRWMLFQKQTVKY